MTQDQLARARALRDRGLSYRQVGQRIGVTSSTVHRWLDPNAAEGDRARQRRRTVQAREQREPTLSPVADAPASPLDFTRAYQQALAAGVDLLEMFDAAYECSRCGELVCRCPAKAERRAA